MPVKSELGTRGLMLVGALAVLLSGVQAEERTVTDMPQVFSMLEHYNEVWETPSENEQGSMPIGNGEIGPNVWVEENGDLLFYIARTDAWSGNGRLLKLGRVRVALDPNPFTAGTPFRQELRLKDGEITINAGEEGKQVRLRVWVDANRPVIHVEADGDQRFQADVSLELWRTARREMDKNMRGERKSARAIPRNLPVIVEPDTVVPAQGNTIRWYHRNEKTCYPVTLTNQHLGAFLDKYPDPIINRTFGGLIEAEGLITKDDKTLTAKAPITRLHVKIYTQTEQTDTADQWLERLERLRAEAGMVPLEESRSAHRAWWNQYWQRSWFFASGDEDAEAVTRAYILQRWINACDGRGRYPIKFNGAIFTVGRSEASGEGHEPFAFDADYRRWGGCYWFQNTRFPYWAMLGSGDYDLMESLWNMYLGMLPLLKDRTQVYFKHDGVYCGETIYFWGLYANRDFGVGNKGFYAGNHYIKYYFQSGIELSAMMLDCFAQTRDEKFAKETLLPITDAVVTFYNEHYERDANGKIRFKPAASLETYRWEVENPLPEIVGLKVVLTRLLALPSSLTSADQRGKWQKMLGKLPPVPTKEKNGKMCLDVAEKYLDKRGNSENPELYAIFPYRLHAVGQPDLEVALNSWPVRVVKRVGCWHQDLVQSAQLGLTEQAKTFVISLAKAKDKPSRFPAFWGAGHDWMPDQCHGGNLMVGIHRMLLQWDDQRRIYLLPAWPKEWNVKFKMHAQNKTIVEGTYSGGKLTTHITPEARRNDVVVCPTRKTNKRS